MTEPLKLRARVLAPVKDVHNALTDAAALRVWLAEHAEVDLPHRYEFWGRYTPEGDAPHQRPLHVDDHTLRLSWHLDETDITIEWRLEEEGPSSTIIELTQTPFDFQEALAGVRIRGALYTFWTLAIANLVDHLEGRELTPKCDFATAQLHGQVHIAAPRDVVYKSLIDSDEHSRWFGYKIDIEPHVGGRVAMGGFDATDSPARILELDPGRKMTIDWNDFVSTWELEDSAGKTRLTFMASGFDPKQPHFGAWLGWLSGISELRRYHELSDWRPIWLENTAPDLPEEVTTAS